MRKRKSDLKPFTDCVSERQLLQMITQLARLYGWRVYHARPALMRSGKWATPLQGDGGLPDLLLCKPPRLIFAELKTDSGRLSEPQREWLDALSKCAGVEVYLWRPSDWQAIVATLKANTEGKATLPESERETELFDRTTRSQGGTREIIASHLQACFDGALHTLSTAQSPLDTGNQGGAVSGARGRRGD